MFEFLFSPKVDTLSFFDWTQRVLVTLNEARKEVEKSTAEDTPANVLKVFQKRVQPLVSMALTGIGMKVDGSGVYVDDRFSGKKIHLFVTDSDMNAVGLPVNESFTRVSLKKYVGRLLTEVYTHHLAKTGNRISRLKHELLKAESDAYFVNRLLESVESGKNGTEEDAPPAMEPFIKFEKPATAVSTAKKTKAKSSKKSTKK
jgi:hypothetical protein